MLLNQFNAHSFQPLQQFNLQFSFKALKKFSQNSIESFGVLAETFKRLLKGRSDYTVPVFWERTIQTAVCGVNAKQTCLAHASPSAVMAPLTKSHAERCLACYPGQSVGPQRL